MAGLTRSFSTVAFRQPPVSAVASYTSPSYRSASLRGPSSVTCQEGSVPMISSVPSL